MRRALVVGAGVSGLVATRALLAAGVSVVISDDREDADGVEEAEELGATHVSDALDRLAAGEFELVVPSPGVPEHAPVIVAALDRGLTVWSEPELGWRLHPRRVLAVTGTNGKTSTTELLTAMLAEADVDAHACGNIGRPFTEAAAASQPDATLVAELSSFQLRFCHQLRPDVGVLLNLAPDHLDWHGSFDAYATAKARMWRAQRADDWAVVNADDPNTVDLATRHAGRAIATFSARDTRPDELPVGVVVEAGRLVAHLPQVTGELLPLADLRVTATHHVANTAAAATAALLAGAPREAVAAAARSFRPGAHRVERVLEHGGVTWVDDSKATNAHAAAAALRSFDPVVWIGGGIAKGVDLSVLGEHLSTVRHAVLIGEAADELAGVCAAYEVPASRAASMEEAVEVAARLAQPGDTVLLAPACSSFDMFRDYADRGERFAAAARAQVEVERGGR